MREIEINYIVGAKAQLEKIADDYPEASEKLASDLEKVAEGDFSQCGRFMEDIEDWEQTYWDFENLRGREIYETSYTYVGPEPDHGVKNVLSLDFGDVGVELINVDIASAKEDEISRLFKDSQLVRGYYDQKLNLLFQRNGESFRFGAESWFIWRLDDVANNAEKSS